MILALALLSFAAPGLSETRYQIDARVDVVRRTVSGHMELVWRNDRDETHQLQLCLDRNRAPERAMEVHSIVWRAGGGDTNVLPDDHGRAVMTIGLPRQVARGETVTLALRWTVQLPRARGDDVLGQQWYPQLASYEEGGWACHPVPADRTALDAPADFDVRLTVPDGWTIAATGREQPDGRQADGVTTHHFMQAAVRDFAWAAGPRYVEHTRHIAEAPSDPKGIDVTLLLQPEHARQAPRLLDAAREALIEYGTWFGPYPDDHLTIVDTPWQSGLSGSAHARLITIASRWLVPPGVLEPEGQVAQGISRQWWGGIVGIDAADDGLVADGLAEYARGRTLEHLFNRRLGRLAYSQYEARYFGGFIPWAFRDVRIERHLGPRGKKATAARAFVTLERDLGWPALQRGFAAVVDAYASRRMSRRELVATMGAAAGQDLTWFLDPVFERSQVFDYAVDDLTTIPVTSCGVTPCFRTTVNVRRRGDAQFSGTSQPPAGEYESGRALTLLVTFADGQTIRDVWDGRRAAKAFVYQSQTPAVSAQIDPAHALVLDVTYTNNSRTLRPRAAAAATTWAARYLTWLEDLLLTCAALV